MASRREEHESWEKGSGPLGITLPSDEPPSAEEIERRRRLFAATMRLRDEIGPIDLTIENLLAEADDLGD